MTVLPADDVVALSEGALMQARMGDAEAVVTSVTEELTRFAANAIHQNVAERSLRLRARVLADNRVGTAASTGEAGADLAARVMAAAESAREVATQTDVSPIPEPDEGADDPAAYSAATAAATPELRADHVAAIARRAGGRGLVAYGYLSTAQRQTAVANTKGVRRSATSTQAGAVVVVRGDAGSGYASRHDADIDRIDIEEMADEAVDTCLRNQGAGAIEPGTYEVVLAPYAVTDLLEHLGWVGFSALAVQEHRSFMRIGEKAMSESVTIRDDCRDPDLFPYPFDAEGVSTQPLDLIARGVCHAVVYDTPTALKDGVRSTGHSLPQPNTWGPYASHLAMLPGESSVPELIAGITRGLYITRFWYVRDVHPLHAIITGMTRDGTFLIENGRLSRPVRDLRFTQSIVDALGDVRGISRERRLELGESETGVLSPWLHLGHFAFSS